MSPQIPPHPKMAGIVGPWLSMSSATTLLPNIRRIFITHCSIEKHLRHSIQKLLCGPTIHLLCLPVVLVLKENLVYLGASSVRPTIALRVRLLAILCNINVGVLIEGNPLRIS